MSNEFEKFLPIGTVVLLKDAKKRLMITGYLPTGKPIEESKEHLYDYMGCVFPEGVLRSSTIAVFNHEQIDKVYHMGLIDVESKDYLNKIKQMTLSFNMFNPIAPDEILNQKGIENKEQGN